jgi:CBS domain-containing protein
MMATKTVSDVMTNDVYAFAQDTSIETAARLLVNRHITGAPVISGAGKPIGVVTIADLVDPDRPRTQRDGYPLYYRVADDELAEVGDDVSVTEGQVADVMSPFVLSIESGASLTEAAHRMLSEQVHRLLVMDDTRLVGIVTSLDLLRGLVTQES